MHETEPSVRMLAYTSIDWIMLTDYINEIGGEKWRKRIGDSTLADAEVLVEFAGRLCYRSWDVGLNPNVTKVREDSREYFTNLLKSRHGSVLEHANFTFIFQDVSRVFTHELVRHRAGVAISQESLRYVRLTDLGFRIPEILETPGEDVLHDPRHHAIVNVIEQLEELQVKMAEWYGLDDPGVDFAYKKQVTSAMRRLAPLGLSTSMVWTANARTLRHVISMRTEKGAEEEIRFVFREVAKIVQARFPFLFGDFEENADGEYVTPFWKV